MGGGGHLPPEDGVTRPVAAEHGVRRIVQIPLRVVAQSGHNLRLAGTGLIPSGAHRQPPQALGIGRHLPGVVRKARHRSAAGEEDLVSGGLRRVKAPPHLLDIPHGPPQGGGGERKAEVVPGLQQDALRRHEALAHRPVGGLAEVAPLGMLDVGPPGGKGDAHVGDGGASEDP